MPRISQGTKPNGEMAVGVGFPWDMPKVLQFGCATKVCRSSRLGDQPLICGSEDHFMRFYRVLKQN